MTKSCSRPQQTTPLTRIEPGDPSAQSLMRYQLRQSTLENSLQCTIVCMIMTYGSQAADPSFTICKHFTAKTIYNEKIKEGMNKMLFTLSISPSCVHSWHCYAPNFEKVGRAYCFGLVRVSVFPCVRVSAPLFLNF